MCMASVPLPAIAAKRAPCGRARGAGAATSAARTAISVVGRSKGVRSVWLAGFRPTDRLVEGRLDRKERSIARVEVRLSDRRQQAPLNALADAQDPPLQLPAGSREIDAMSAEIALVGAALDQAPALKAVEQAHERRALDAEGVGQFLLPDAFAQPAEIGERPPCRLAQAVDAQLGIDGLANAPSNPRHPKAEFLLAHDLY